VRFAPIAFALMLLACTDSSASGDAAPSDGSTNDGGSIADGGYEAAPGQCIFGKSHFNDGCKFGP
jgi:hypothetical protein